MSVVRIGRDGYKDVMTVKTMLERRRGRPVAMGEVADVGAELVRLLSAPPDLEDRELPGVVPIDDLQSAQRVIYELAEGAGSATLKRAVHDLFGGGVGE